MKNYPILSFIIALSVSLVSCGGDEIPEDIADAQTPLETLNTPINAEEMVLIPAGDARLGTDSKNRLDIRYRSRHTDGFCRGVLHR